MGFCSSQAHIFPVYHILHKSFLFSSGPSKSVLDAPANNKRFVMQWEPSSPVCLFPGNLFQVGWWLVPGGSFCLHMKEEPCFEVFHFELGFGNWNKRKWRSAVSVPSQHRSGEISPLRKAAEGLEHQLEPALFCFSLLFYLTRSCRLAPDQKRGKYLKLKRFGAWENKRREQLGTAASQWIPYLHFLFCSHILRGGFRNSVSDYFAFIIHKLQIDL